MRTTWRSRVLCILVIGISLAGCNWRRTATNQNTAVNQFEPPPLSGEVKAGDETFYRGAINGTNRIEMRLVRDGDNASGSYVYTKVGKPLTVRGTFKKNGEVALEEFDEQGAKTGVFKGKWKDPATEHGATIEGSWTKPNGSGEQSFYLYEQAISLPMGLKVVTKQIRERNKQHRYEINADYPEITGPITPEMRAFNLFVAAEINRAVSAWKRDAGRDPNAEDPMPEAGDDSLDISYDICLANAELMSVRFWMGTYFHGAAHPNSSSQVVNFNLKTGKEIKMPDLFRPGAKFLKAISDYCINDLKNRKEEGSNERLLDEQQVRDGAAPTTENYGSWNITRKGLMITFDAYQVGAYALGPQQVIIPYPALRDMIDPEGPTGSFAK